MLADLAIPGLIAALVLLCSIIRWQWAFLALLIYLPFAGMITLWLRPSNIGALLKDLMFVIPLYATFFSFHLRRIGEARIPKFLILAIGLFATIVLLQILNPGLSRLMVAFIGAKVWLFYIPLMVVAAVYIDSPQRLTNLLRLLVVLAVIPAGIGIIQFAGANIWGYREVMMWFYGDAAYHATQGFTKFDYGGTFYRIPSTFSFVAQYIGFLFAMIPVAYMLIRSDPSTNWRNFGRLAMFLLLIASLLSGSRSVFVFVPLIIILLLILDGRIVGTLAGILAVPALILTALYLSGLNPILVLTRTRELLADYSGGLVVDSMWTALTKFPFGTGTGMNTGAARHAFESAEALDIFGLESYYAKAVVELGVPGLISLILLIFSILAIAYKNRHTVRDPALKSCVSALFAFFIVIYVNSAKGWILDLDPMNVYFWVFVGIMVKLPYIDYGGSAVTDADTLRALAAKSAAARKMPMDAGPEPLRHSSGVSTWPDPGTS